MQKAKVVNFQSTQPRSRFRVRNATRIPQSPIRVQLATLRVQVKKRVGFKNTVELLATVGVRGIKGISQIDFRIFRDGKEIFRTRQGIESAGSERNYVVTFQAIDFNVTSGMHVYTLTAQNVTPGTTANVVGPISFSALVVRKRMK